MFVFTLSKALQVDKLCNKMEPVCAAAGLHCSASCSEQAFARNLAGEI